MGICFFYCTSQVLEMFEESFSVRYLVKSGSSYAYGREDYVGNIKEGPPDFHRWRRVDYQINKKGLFVFDC